MNDTKNLRKVTLSSFVAVLLGICYMFLKLTAVLPKAVPYSDLIMNLQIGSVQNVLFEEGSRRIYYNTVPESSNDPQLLENPTPSEDVVSSENVGDTGVLADQTKKLCVLGGSVLGKFTKKKVSAREWQYSNRKIDHDENFLLTLMREKGTAYSSAPQSVLMSMRNILITILSLWIPLTPLMWLLYRQASAANSPAKKRHPTNQIVSFDDVEGVDTAKAELLETVPATGIPDGWMGLDIGPDSIKTFSDALETTKTVIWNGPMGVFEFDKFAVGTEAIAKKLADLSGKGVTTIEEEVENVYERLQALEADREFLKQSISSLKKGDKGMDLLREILQYLRDLRSVELCTRNMSDASLS